MSKKKNKKIEETVEEPIEETVEEPIEETVEEPIEETVEEPIEETVEEPIEETVVVRKYKDEIIVCVEDVEINGVSYKRIYNDRGTCFILNLSQYDKEVK